MTLDGAWHEQKDELVFVGLGHLETSELGAVLEHTVGVSRSISAAAGCFRGTRTTTSTAIPRRASLPRRSRVRRMALGDDDA